MRFNLYDPNAFHAIMAILSMMAGFGLGAAGYRFKRFTIPAGAFFIGGDYTAAVIAMLIDGFAHEYEYWIAFFVGGLAFAGTAMIRVPVGVAITGFSAGVVLTVMLLTMENSDTGSVKVQIVMMTIVGLLVGALTFKTQKFGLIGATSFAGAYMLMDGVRHFVNTHVVNAYLEEMEEEKKTRSRYSYRKSGKETLSLSERIRSAWWTVCVIMIVLFAVFAAVQKFVTAQDVDVSEKREDEDLDHQYASSDTPSRGRNQLAPATNPVALV